MQGNFYYSGKVIEAILHRLQLCGISFAYYRYEAIYMHQLQPGIVF